VHALLVTAHPEPTSFTGALAERAVAVLTRAGHTATVSDLYAEGFDPVAGRHDFAAVADAGRFHYQTEQEHAARTDGFSDEIRREQARLAEADLVVLLFPLWWGAPPAILKGWFERVLAYGFAYVDGRRFDTGLFKGRRALVAVTTGGTPERFSEGGVYGPIEGVLRSVEHLTLGYMGFEVAPPFVAYAAPRVGAAERQAYLDAWERRILEAVAAPVERAAETSAEALAGVGRSGWTRGGA
jgi:NAD(P)H dehydrogenase (quinone)